jgi:sulfur-carrier protein
MKKLLELALDAHGGLRRWSQLKAVTADLSVTGALLADKRTGRGTATNPDRSRTASRRADDALLRPGQTHNVHTGFRHSPDRRWKAASEPRESGANLLRVLQALFAEYPGLRDRVLTETGETRQHVNIFVANVNVRYTGGLATAIAAGTEVSLHPAQRSHCSRS